MTTSVSVCRRKKRRESKRGCFRYSRRVYQIDRDRTFQLVHERLAAWAKRAGRDE